MDAFGEIKGAKTPQSFSWFLRNTSYIGLTQCKHRDIINTVVGFVNFE